VNAGTAYNARCADGLKDMHRSGRPPKLGSAQRAEVGRWLEESTAAGVPSWTIGLVRERIAGVFKVALSMESVRTLMHSLGFCRQTRQHSDADAAARHGETCRGGRALRAPRRTQSL